MKFLTTYTQKGLLSIALLMAMSSCEVTDLDINTDPNKPLSAALNLLLAPAELGALNIGVVGINSSSTTYSPGNFRTVSDNASGFTGIMNSADSYGLDNNTYNGTWNTYYRNLQNVEQILRVTTDGKNPYYRGIALAMKAYAMGNMVDMFGDVPYSKAWQGNVDGSDRNVAFDKDSEIYEDLLKLCDQAVAEFGKAQAVAVSGDVIGGGSAATWIRLAKTIKLRLLMNSRKGRATGNAELKAAFDAGGYITTSAQDFYYQYSKQLSPQDDRHPWAISTYNAGNGFTYINHQMMGEMILNKDPRFGMYFFRQTDKVLDAGNPTDRGTIPYGGTYIPTRPAFLAEYKRVFYNDKQDPTADDIKFLAGIFGRDRGDNTGAPADGTLRTVPGAYPAGGLYGGREIPAKALTGSRDGAGGNGIWPLIMSWNVKFYQVEAILDGTGVTGDARALFETAMREQIASVVKFAQAADTKTPTPAAADVTAYVNAWLALYDAAPTNQGKLNTVAKQIWFCSWGQGQEIWNLMRRTGYPVQGPFKQFSTGIQSPILKPGRQYALRLPYPAQEGNLNSNAAKYVSDIIFDRDPVFWDKVKVKWEF
ncbi:SusD/RagB family nutrient-binding outer membrane lipoprotein [Spirosoma endbachense]|uniref:SusD/RagB family nutrient-binding outer membrane lipoprotein n=1 Tax=Spirosoma endbachense TaxID=2666025 RepID=A0A6P1VYY2_9BACT|nr:SusD/RagB family nutrient-binding outer membrane lipoprotein [Spirosoma endbachense]QHV97528.1 SusD/RagB family nutrient-binding outer membrane lipoprotein [Spirosoma endbachense]